MLKQWREIKYLDDGVSLYECLACKGTWQGCFSYSQITYCMHCGIKYDGKLEWEPKTEQDRERRSLKFRFRNDRDQLDKMDWRLERKLVWRDGGQTPGHRDWEWVSRSPDCHDCDEYFNGDPGVIGYSRLHTKTRLLKEYRFSVKHAMCGSLSGDLGCSYRIALYDKETYYSDWNNKPKPIAIYGETDPFDDEDK
jgi:hypothetical protein